jgi:hypothetical protein
VTSPEEIQAWDVTFHASNPKVANFGTNLHGL